MRVARLVLCASLAFAGSVHSEAGAAPIGFLEWVDCTASDAPFEFEIECLSGGVNSLFRVTNVTPDYVGDPAFPSTASSFSDIRILFDGVESGNDPFAVAPGSGGTLFSLFDPAPNAMVSLILTLDAAWIGTLIFPELTAANGGMVAIDFTPLPPARVPEPGTLLMLGTGLAAGALRRYLRT